MRRRYPASPSGEGSFIKEDGILVNRVGRICTLGGLLSLACAPVHANTGEPEFNLGGAVRFSYGWLDYGPSTDFEPELVRIDADGRTGPAFFSLQYRWYDGFDALHHAYVGWELDDSSDIRAGVQQAPFGLLPYASHSFWFGSGYYLGIEDDYDLGVVWQREQGPHQFHAGVFFGDEYGSGARYDRYSFDVAQTDDLPYRERERVNLRYEHTGAWGGGELKLGGSLFHGRVEQRVENRKYDHDGAALHAHWERGPTTVQLQWARYRYRTPESRIAMSAFMFPFEIAAEADVPTFNVAYELPRAGWFDAITCYNNLSTTQPVRSDPGLRESWQNVTGCSFAKDKMFTYVDWIAGKNMWFVGGDGIGIEEPGSNRWRSRLNINIGFYF